MAFDFSVTGNTKLDTSGFTQGVSSMTVAAGTLIADLVKTASSQLTNLAQSAIQNGSIYETSLAKVGTIADLGKLSIQKLGSQITDMSNTMGIAATDIAEATYQAISAGQDTANAVEFAGQAAKLATAGFTSTTSAVDILTTALNAYGLSADQATHVSDVLLTTQNLGKTSVDELSSSMGRVIPLAAVQWSGRDDRQRYRHCRGDHLHKIHAERAGRHRVQRRQDFTAADRQELCPAEC